ncbi:preprotein translocase subunit SecE [Candidatus Woesebacteria bacterium RIFCSPLOWO2_01_FULL_39_10]|uniref:Protein translocase subunit SecE n=1 Tax=Candidatus Woesebacteria bacterium RIFCSPLOWO2_01_FULL_39_10 TaxID=1802516 RepID=A0A1F8B704_9BACT|nr:MAG: preprotein translocase subunit SecE [Candidatus Woesebacteria bacterium RIFCSPLOWO2_01_FULL_39_10]
MLIKFTPVKVLIDYLKDVRLELSKVVWPKRAEVIRLTLTVFAISGIIGAYVGVLDFALTKLLEFLIS